MNDVKNKILDAWSEADGALCLAEYIVDALKATDLEEIKSKDLSGRIKLCIKRLQNADGIINKLLAK